MKTVSKETRLKMRLAKLGKKRPHEVRLKISESLKGNKRSLGIVRSPEFKEKISRAFKGSRHWNWKGGIKANDLNRYHRERYKKMTPKQKLILSIQRNKNNGLKKNRGTYSVKEWMDLKKIYNYTCPSCKRKEPFVGQKSKYLTTDHIIPLTKGGRNTLDNIQPLCGSCNCKKHAKIIPKYSIL